LLLLSRERAYTNAEVENKLDTVNYLDRKEWKYTLRNIGIRTLIVGL